MNSIRSNDCTDTSKRQALALCGKAAATVIALPALRVLPTAGAAAALWRPSGAEAFPVATVAFLAGWGLKILYDKFISGRQPSAEQRLRDRMGAFAWPDVRQNGPQIFLGRHSEPASPFSQLNWPEFGYHDAKFKENDPFLYPNSPAQRVSMSDKEIFEEALRKSQPGMTSNRQAYARNYQDTNGRNLRIVAARANDGRVYVAESDGRDVKGYQIHAAGE